MPSFSTKPETADEYLERVRRESKEFYKTPDKMIDEMIRLMAGAKENLKDDDDRLWDLAIAVNEAWHIMLFVAKEKRVQRLATTMISWIHENTTGI